jgi:hypothetical protein
MSDERVDINIEQLILELPFRDGEQGRALTAEIVRRLRQMPPLLSPGSSLRLPDLRVDLPPASAPATDSQVAQAVAAGIHRALSQAMEAASPGPAAQKPPGAPARAPAPVTPPAKSPVTK